MMNQKIPRPLPSKYPIGNTLLWKEILPNWTLADIERAVYMFPTFRWENKNSVIEKRAKIYIEFAQQCSQTFKYRENRRSWNYDEIMHKQDIDTETLLARANLLLHEETNLQLKARYYYQMIRILHYSKLWSDAIRFFENEIEGKLPENEIYHYIIDQVAGCYYSTENYDKAAYLFTKVVNQSYDRKKSAFSSYNFCVNKGFEGRALFNGLEDEKDLLLIKSLHNFSDRISNINEFIELDANDKRVELLFMRALNNIERNVWPKNIGTSTKSLPYTENKENIDKLTAISIRQASNPKVINKDFWLLTRSYLSFINQDLKNANLQLKEVKTFSEQTTKLSIIYSVFGWDKMTRKNENALAVILKEHAIFDKNHKLVFDTQNDWIKIILDKVAHVYYSENQLAKAFLIHNNLETLNYLNSYPLLNSLETLHKKRDKSDFERTLVLSIRDSLTDFIGYVYNQKGIYHLYQQNPDSALYYFNKNSTYKNPFDIPAQIFSNNTKEGFRSPADKIMVDEVYKANVFSFIKPEFSRKELAENLQKLEELRHDSAQWKRKLANYLLGNYYFNISNTGYYRGRLKNRPDMSHHHFFDRYNLRDQNAKKDDEIIENRVGYNLANIELHRKKYFQLSDIARKYYVQTIEESSDDELNARCIYMMAKCELNDYYNKGGENTFEIKHIYGTLTLPEYESFKILKEKYSDTKFHEMIIKECSYFRYYSALY